MGNTKNQQKSFARQLDACIIFLIISCLMVGVVVGISRQAGGPVGTTELVEGDQIIGTPGQEITTASAVPTSDIILLNEPPKFDNHWLGWSHPHAPGSWQSRLVRRSLSEEGLELELDATEVVFWTRVNIPLNVCSSMEYNSSITLITGQIEVTLEVEFRDYPWTDLENMSLQQKLTLTPSNTSTLVSLSAPLTALAERVPHFSVSSHVRLTIVSEFSSHLIIGNVSVSGKATQDMCRVSIDIQSLDGLSINANPNTPWIYDKPFVNLTNQDDSWSMFPIVRPNEIIYLQPGQYEGKAGWGFDYVYGLYSQISVNLTLASGDTAVWNIRLHCARVFIDSRPNLPEMSLWIWKDSVGVMNEIFESPFNSTLSNHLYLPLSEDPRHFIIRIHSNPPNQYSYRIVPFAREVSSELDSSHEWNVEITLPMIEYSGFALRLEDAVLLVIGVILFSLMIVRILTHFELQGFSNVLRDPRFLPFILLATTIFLPWAEYSRTSSWIVGDSTVHLTKMSPLALLLMWSSGSDIVLQPGIYWFYYLASSLYYQSDASVLLLSAIFLFWIPFVYLFTKIGDVNKWKIDSKFILALLGPILLTGIAFIPNPYVTFEGLIVGSYVAVSALPLYLLLHLGRRIRFWSSKPD